MGAIKFKTNDKQAAEDLIREFTKPYQDYADKVLQIAEAMNLPLNHKHYHTVEEVKLQYAKRNGVKATTVSTKSRTENLKNPYSDAEKAFFAQGGTKSEVIARFRAAGIGADKRTDMAIYQSFNKFLNKNKKTTVAAPVVEEKKTLTLITVPPVQKVNEDLFSKKVKLAKELGAKSIVIDNVTINF